MNRPLLLKSLDATAGSALCRLIGRTGLLGVRRMPPAHSPLTSGRRLRILVIRPGGMGDLILLLPALQAVQQHFPAAELTVVCETRNAAVLPLTNLCVTALLYDRAPFACCRALRRRHFDVVIDTEQFHHFSALLAILTGAPMRIGFNINPRRNPLYTHLVPYAVDGPEVRQFLRLLAPLGIRTETAPVAGVLPRIPVELPAILQNSARTPQQPLIVVHPATGSRYKDWGSAPFAGLIESLIRQYDAYCVVLGNEDDADLCRSLAEAVPSASRPRVLSLAGRTALRETAGVIKAASLFVGLDSGPAHIAAACDVPSVILYGATDPDKWAATEGQCRVVRRRVPCAPCAIFGYHKPCNSVACIRGITTDDVLDAIASVLG
jgi:heptosyltransferase II